MGAMPRAVFDGAAFEKAAHLGAFRTGDPVAGIGWVRVAAVAVIGHLTCAYEIITGNDAAGTIEDIAVDVGMREESGINYGHDDIGVAGRDIPGARQIDATDRVGRGHIMPLIGVAGIVGDRHGLHELVGLGVFNVGVIEQTPGYAARFR